MEDLIESRTQKRRLGLANAIYIILFVLLVVVIVLTQLFAISEVSGESMRETIQNGDYIIILRAGKIERGDIVTADAGTVSIVKRVIATPGDRLVFAREGSESDSQVVLYLDKGQGFERVDEDFIRFGRMTLSGFVHQNLFMDGEYELYSGKISEVTEPYIIELGKKEYFLMGDNRDQSKDSRSYGAFSEKDIMGKVVKIVREGREYFLISIFYDIMDWLGLNKGRS